MPSGTVITAESYKTNFAKKPLTLVTSSLPGFDAHPLDLSENVGCIELAQTQRRHRHANVDATHARTCPIKFDSYNANSIAKAYVVLVS